MRQTLQTPLLEMEFEIDEEEEGIDEWKVQLQHRLGKRLDQIECNSSMIYGDNQSMPSSLVDGFNSTQQGQIKELELND
ncbi:unnamed protein product [Linum trigynum]|uniref:Uncharacterized protein n=1 Tax=Linum trigynum TaxID=586398 RepID=A0AAV2EP33_9ROSI